MNKKELILKEKNIKLKVETNYLEFKKNGLDFIISYKHINNIYLTTTAQISLKDLIKIAKKVPLFIIDNNGYIVAEVKVDV